MDFELSGLHEGPTPAPARVLILDDEPMIQVLVARCLESAGHEVVTLRPAHGTMKLVTEARFDLVITNSMMAGVNGARLVGQLRGRFPGLPLLHLDDQAHPRAAEFPPDVPTLNKPFTSDELCDCVKQLLGR